jgi:hypothetical protein
LAARGKESKSGSGFWMVLQMRIVLRKRHRFAFAPKKRAYPFSASDLEDPRILIH